MLINGVAKEYFMNVVNKVRYVCLIKWVYLISVQ